MSLCHYCNESFDFNSNLNILKCNGPCLAYFHVYCTNLNNQQWKILQTCKNISWNCDNCSNMCATKCNNKLMIDLIKYPNAAQNCEWNEARLCDMENRLNALEEKLLMSTRGVGELSG